MQISHKGYLNVTGQTARFPMTKEKALSSPREENHHNIVVA